MSNSIALFSLIVLVACIAIGFVLKKNVGLIAVLAAAVFGSAAGYTDSQIIKGFSSSTFIMLLGVSLLCTIATNNGTLELAAKKFLRLSGGHVAITPVIMYLIGYIVAAIGPGCVHLGVDNIEKIGAIGKAGYLWQTRILDERGNDVAPGEIGELAVKGPGVMKCYYKNPEATAEILHGDWLWTGDMAREDKDGFIYLVDRKKDVIISGGENLYPVQIEDFLRRNEKIKDVAVIGLPDQRLGEIAAAIIELKDGADCTETEIQDFCRELPRYKRPRRVIFAKVPRSPTGKIEKPVLRQIYCGGRLVEEQTKA